MQATISHFDPTTRTGRVVLDDGSQLVFDRAAFDAGELRTVRVGQRVRLEVDQPERGDATPPTITAVWLATVHPLA